MSRGWGRRVSRGWLRTWGGRTKTLHLARLPLLQELGLLVVRALDGSLHACVGILLRKVGVITILHLCQRFALLLLARLHRYLLSLVVEVCSGGRLGRGRYRLRFRQIARMHRNRTARTGRADV